LPVQPGFRLAEVGTVNLRQSEADCVGLHAGTAPSRK